MIRRAALSALCAFVFFAVGCGERPQVIQYKSGQYQGKQDSDPWKNPPFDGNRDEWEKALKARAQAQNEYRRVN